MIKCSQREAQHYIIKILRGRAHNSKYKLNQFYFWSLMLDDGTLTCRLKLLKYHAHFSVRQTRIVHCTLFMVCCLPLSTHMIIVSHSIQFIRIQSHYNRYFKVHMTRSRIPLSRIIFLCSPDHGSLVLLFCTCKGPGTRSMHVQLKPI